MDGTALAVGCGEAFVPALLPSGAAGATKLVALSRADGRAAGEDLLRGGALWNAWEVVGPGACAFQVIE